jgi:hypothetical protein
VLRCAIMVAQASAESSIFDISVAFWPHEGATCMPNLAQAPQYPLVEGCMTIDVVPWLAEQFRLRGDLNAYGIFKELCVQGVAFKIEQPPQSDRLQMSDEQVAELCGIIVNFPRDRMRFQAAEISNPTPAADVSQLAAIMRKLAEDRENRVATIEARAHERVRRMYNTPTSQPNAWNEFVDLIERLNERRDAQLSVSLNESDYLYQG